MGEADNSTNAELLALHRLDKECTRLQCDGNYLEALECMERGLVLRQHFFGPESEEVWKACKTVAEMCNLLAMTYLQQEDFVMVHELLKKAEILTERDDGGRAVTYNNLACYFRRQGKLHSALKSLQKALKVEQSLEKVENHADTHLNLCAVMSQLGRHAAALEHAQSALILLQEELFPGLGDIKSTVKELSADRIAVLSIAYHNIGVEQEFLRRNSQALLSYRRGVELSENHLGSEHGITITLRNSFIAAKRTLEMQKRNRGPLSKPSISLENPAKKTTARRRKPSRRRNEEISKKSQRWNQFENAYGRVAGEIKPRGFEVISEDYDLSKMPLSTLEENAQTEPSHGFEQPNVKYKPAEEAEATAATASHDVALFELVKEETMREMITPRTECEEDVSKVVAELVDTTANESKNIE